MASVTYGNSNLWQVLLMAIVTYGKCYLWQKYYVKCIMANETKPCRLIKSIV